MGLTSTHCNFVISIIAYSNIYVFVSFNEARIGIGIYLRVYFLLLFNIQLHKTSTRTVFTKSSVAAFM